MGKLVLPSPPVFKSATKQEILRNLDFPQLRFDYDRFVNAIDWYYTKYGITNELQDLILDCCNEVTNFMGAYPLDEANINISMKEMVRVFELKMQIIMMMLLMPLTMTPPSSFKRIEHCKSFGIAPPR
jgi:hypothetical protein